MGVARPSNAVLAATLILLTASYGAVVIEMVGIWSAQSVYSYGFVVPLISAYICWTKWQEHLALESPPDYRFGVPLTLAGMTMLLVGRAGAIINLQFASFVVSLAGCVLLVFGRETFKRYWFPIAYLLLMVPIWNMAIDRLQDPSRIVSAKIATGVLRTIGIPVLREGTYIVLPSHTLSVMRECSGVNQLVAMVAMVLPAAYLWMTGRLRRVMIVILSIAITYASNGCRIALIGWLAFNGYGDGNLLGAYTHVSEGLAVALLGYLAIGGCFTLMSRGDRNRDELPGAEPMPPSAAGPGPHRRLWLDVATVTLVLLVASSPLFAISRDVPLPRDLAQLPATIGDWTWAVFDESPGSRLTGVSVDLVDAYRNPTGELRFEGVDRALIRTYQNSAGARVQLYVGYYGRQEEGKELTGNASNGLRLAGSSVAVAPGLPDVGEVAREKGGVRRGLLYWYDVNGKVVPDIYVAKAYTVWNTLTRRRSDGAVVMIAWEGPAGAAGNAARQRALAFAASLQPLLRQLLPH
jgi:EpsI family protein